jgi:co-chaperonin GroES (HSP10)
MPVSVGQVVLFKKYAPDEIKVDGEEFLVITLSDVMAIVE